MRKAIKRDLPILVFFIILIILFIGLPSIIHAEIGSHIYVDANNTGYADGTEANPFSTISQAIETASSYCTIHVAPGHYDSVYFRKDNIILQGADPATTIIHGEVQFGWPNMDCILDGFTITESETCGVHCRDSNPIISRCIIRQNNHHGVGIWGGAPRIDHCIIWGNGKYGLYNSWGNPFILNSIIWDNQEAGLRGTGANFCIVQGYTWDNSDEGHGLIYQDPLFVDAEPENAPHYDFHLQSIAEGYPHDSVAIDTGSSDGATGDWATDIGVYQGYERFEPVIVPRRKVLQAEQAFRFFARGGTPPYTWSSSNTDVALVDPNGWVTALNPGYALINVTESSSHHAQGLPAKVLVENPGDAYLMMDEPDSDSLNAAHAHYEAHGDHLGLALTGLVRCLDQPDPDMEAFLNGFNIIYHGLFTLDDPNLTSGPDELGKVPADAPGLDDLQGILQGSIIPCIETSIGHLDMITDPSYKRYINPEDDDVVEVDIADIDLLKAGFHATHALIDVITAYILWDPNLAYSDLDNPFEDPNGEEISNGANNFLADHPELLYLLPAALGEERMASALSHIQEAVDLVMDGFEEIQSETDSQFEDLISLDTLEAGHDDVDEFQEDLADALHSLDPNTPPVTTYQDYVEDTPCNPLEVDLSAFFLNPLDRDDLPQFDEENEPDLDTIPDPTLHGILPGITPTRLNGMILNGIDVWGHYESFDWPCLDCQNIINWRMETDIGDLLNISIYRDAEPCVDPNTATLLIIIDANDIQEFTLPSQDNSEAHVQYIDNQIDCCRQRFYYLIVATYANPQINKNKLLTINNINESPICLIYPQDGSTVGPAQLVLKWEDPDATSYDLYFGSELPLEKIAQGLSAGNFQLPELEYNSSYTWQVVSKRPDNIESSSPDWRFYTYPAGPDTGFIQFTDLKGKKVEEYAGEQATIVLQDSDLDANPGSSDTALVFVSSSTQVEPEEVVLTEIGPSTGYFFGSIPFDSAGEDPTIDGDLDVSPGDDLIVRYNDAADANSNPSEREDTAFYINYDVFLDTDSDNLPDYWEKKYFGNLDMSDTDDPDGDSYANIYEYKNATLPIDFESIPNPNLYVDHRISGGDGSFNSPFSTIQDALDAANNLSIIEVRPGTYTGPGNMDLDFLGKAIYLKSESGPQETFVDCNEVGRGAYFHNGEDNLSIIYGFTFLNGQATEGGAIACDSADPIISRCAFINNNAQELGGALAIRASNPVIEGCLFAGNQSEGSGGGIGIVSSSRPIILNCTLIENNAILSGGGIYGKEDSRIQVLNTILWDNQAPMGHEIYIEGLGSNASSLTVSYSDVMGGEAEIGVDGDSSLNWGPENIAIHPFFSEEKFLNYNYHLAPSSPCIDAGMDIGLDILDLDGQSRPYHTSIDIGADEYTGPLLDFILIHDVPEGISLIWNRTMHLEENLTVWAIGYDIYWDRIGPVPVYWTGTGVCQGNLSHDMGVSSTFIPSELGTGQIMADTPFLDDEPDSATETLHIVDYLIDLQVTNFSLPAEALSGQTIDITWTVSNLGSGATTRSWTDRIYLSSDDQFGSDTYLDQYWHSDGLQAGESYEHTSSLKIPDGIEGNHWIIIFTDEWNEIYEYQNEENNITSRPIKINLSPYPDLQVTDISLLPEAFSGQTVNITWTVSNLGEAPATGDWWDRIYLSSDAQLGSDPILANFEYTLGLGIGESCTRTQPVEIPDGINGDRWIILVTDGMNNIYEYQDEDNNDDNKPIRIILSPYPDLQVTSVDPPAVAWSGTTISINWTVTNTGNGDTDNPIWYDQLWFSSDTVLDTQIDIHVGVFPNASYLAKGESYVETREFNIPNGIAGPYYILAITDCYNYIYEHQGETNNTSCNVNPFQINLTPSPDLQVTSVNAPGNGWSGQPSRISWTVTNQGSGSTVQTSWVDTLFLSPNEILNINNAIRLNSFTHQGALLSSDSYTRDEEVVLPERITGLYYLFVLTDSQNDIYEHVGEHNNSSYDATSIEITLTPPPDLAISAISAPSITSSGEVIAIEWTVENVGASATHGGYWTDSIYLSPNDILDNNSDILIGSQVHYGDLEPGDGYSGNKNITIPNGIFGNYNLIVYIDSNNSVFEYTWEENNINHTLIEISLTSPSDLEISSAIIPSGDVLSGHPFEVSWTVTNSGDGKTAGDFWKDTIYLSNDSFLERQNDFYLGTFAHSDVLQSNGSYTQTVTLIAPAGLSGIYYLFILTDYDNHIYEHEAEDNNSHMAYLQLILPPAPDLVVSSVVTPDTALSGQPLTIDWAVSNTGQVRTYADSWTDAVYLSQDEILNAQSDILLCRFGHIGALATGETYHQSGTVTLPNGLSGSYYIFVQTDADNTVKEYGPGHEKNNFTYSLEPIQLDTPPTADLYIESVEAPDTGVAGQPITIQWTVVNIGSRQTTVSQWNDTFYLSKDLVLDLYDYQLGYLTHKGALVPGASYESSKEILLPRGIGGHWYVLVFTDRGDKVYEHQAENNNLSYDPYSIDISLAPPADLVVSAISHPLSGMTGESITINWTVTNQGDNNAVGLWWDSVYLSVDDIWDIGDTKVGYAQHNGSVAPGGQYNGSLTAELPGATPGQYYVIVRTDIKNNVREGTQENNNIGTSSGTISTDATELTLGTPYESQIGSGTMHYYKVAVPEGEDLLITLDCASDTAFTELYVRYGQMPDRGHFDFIYDAPFKPDQEISVDSTREGVYYILVCGGAISEATANYTITAKTLDFSIRKVTPDKGGNVGEITLEITGARFKQGIYAELLNIKGQSRSAKNIYFVNGVTIYATFDLVGLVPGDYNLRLINKDNSICESNNIFEVIPGQGPKLLAKLITPSFLRPDQDFTIWIEYANVGDTDMIPPLFIVSNENGVPMSIHPDEKLVDSPIQILGVSFYGPSGVVRPGTHHSIPIYSHSSFRKTESMNFKLRTWLPSEREVSNTESVKAAFKPKDIDIIIWNNIWDSIRARIGTTWKDYLSAIAEDATLINLYFGDVVYSIKTLFLFEIDMVMIEREWGTNLKTRLKILDREFTGKKSGEAKPVRIYMRRR